VRQGIEEFDWYNEKVTVPAAARHGVMEGVVWTIPRRCSSFSARYGPVDGSRHRVSLVPAEPMGRRSARNRRFCRLRLGELTGHAPARNRRYGCSWSVGACFARYGGSFRFGRGGNGMAGGPAGSRRQPVFGSRAGARADVRAQGPGCGRDGWRGCCGQLDAGVLQPVISSRHRSCRAGRRTAAHRPRRARRSGSRPAPARPAARPCVTPPAPGRRNGGRPD
jgi:hypothetical protein